MRYLTVVLLLSGAVLAGCGSDDDGPTIVVPRSGTTGPTIVTGQSNPTIVTQGTVGTSHR